MKKQTLHSFLWGIGSLGNVAGDYLGYQQQSDYEALLSDWKAVGEDMRTAMNMISGL